MKVPIKYFFPYDVWTTYDKLVEKVDQISDKSDNRFKWAIYKLKFWTPLKTVITIPDLDNPEPLFKGRWSLISIITGRNATKTINNPTIKDIIKFGSRNNDGHHVYLDNLYFSEDTATIELEFGS